MTQSFSPMPRRTPPQAPFFNLDSLFRAESGDALLAMTLASGGDERIALTPDGRNGYGAPIRPAEGEIWFASSTASPISPRGWAAAKAALPFAFSALEAESWFADLRRRLLKLLAPPGAEAIFCASGTEAEYAALALARSLDGAVPRPLASLLVGAGEHGRGTPYAAAGRDFLASAPFGPAKPGRPVDGWEEGAIELAAIPIRGAKGAPLTPAEIDARCEFSAREILSHGWRLLAHVLDCSKTGLAGFSRRLASQLLAEFPDQVTVVVDACQLRCPPEKVRADLEAGFMVMVTGSKFAGGPALAGALLLPPRLVDQLSRLRRLDWAEGLAAHMAALDWPARLREKNPGPFGARVNSGLGLRWEAALAEYELFCSLDPKAIEYAAIKFGEAARGHVAHLPHLVFDDARGAARTIFSIVSRDASGAPLPARPIQRKLRAQGVHLGQPVPLGHAEALRLCLAAPQINDFALRLESGMGEKSAFAPLARDMQTLFDKWGAIVAGC